MSCRWQGAADLAVRAPAARVRRLAAIGISIALAAAAASFAASGAPRADTALRDLIGDAACEDDAQCHTVAIGNQACGGPEAYMAWSEQGVDALALNRLASASRARRPQRYSTCSVVLDPGARCMPPAAAAAASGAPRHCRLNAAPARGALPDR